MAKKEELQKCNCGSGCDCGTKPHGFGAGFNFGFGFWTAWLLVSTIVALLAVLFWWLTSLV